MEYRAKVFEASSCDKDRNTKSIHAWPIEDGGVILMIGNFPGRDESPSFEHLNEIHGIIFLNKGHAVDFANEIIRATQSEKPDTISYDFIPETGWDVLSPGMKLLLESVKDSGV
jgi:hypothetical protein